MLEMNLINLGMYIGALAINAVLLMAAIFGLERKEKIFRYFFLMVFLNIFGTLSDFMIVLLQGTPGEGMNLFLTVMDFGIYLFSALALMAFAFYFYEYMRTKTSISRYIKFATVILCAGLIIQSVFAHIKGMYGVFDENNIYSTDDDFWASYTFMTAIIFNFIFVILKHIKALRPKEWIVLLTYMVMPLICYVIELIFDGLWPSYLGTALSFLLVYMTIQVDIMHKLSEQDAELAESRISIMLSQIQPHFLYNSLTSISDIVSDNKEANDALIDFANYLRGNLDSLSQKNLISFETELEHTRQYLNLEKIRFEEKLNVKYDLKVTEFLLPVLSLQPIVENAVNHGITQKGGGGTIIIKTEADRENYFIIVTDDGVGFVEDSTDIDGRSHNGIKNVRDRLEQMCGGSLDVESVVGEGTTAVIAIPK